MIDTSGEGLHKRGYRARSNEAPLKETLAASLCQLSRLRPDGHFIDPFCGSGTLLVEAALLACQVAPGLHRSFTAQTWPDVPPALWDRERELARSKSAGTPAFTGRGSTSTPPPWSSPWKTPRRRG